jgi:hypothetical protein
MVGPRIKGYLHTHRTTITASLWSAVAAVAAAPAAAIPSLMRTLSATPLPVLNTRKLLDVFCEPSVYLDESL